MTIDFVWINRYDYLSRRSKPVAVYGKDLLQSVFAVCGPGTKGVTHPDEYLNVGETRGK